MVRSERIRSHAERSAIGKLKKESVMQRQEANGARATRFCSILALTMPAVLDLAENSHQPTRRREWQMKQFKSTGQAQRFLAAHDQINNLFHLRRDHVTAAEYRAARMQTFRVRAEIGGSAAITI
jgi:transposase-like protein